MSVLGDALEALFGVIDTAAQVPGASIPRPLANEALPARLVEMPSGLEQHLNIWDSGEQQADEFVGADSLDQGYELEWPVPIDYVVAGGTREQRRAAFEAGLEAIWDAIAADRTLGGKIAYAEMSTPRRTGSGLVTDGMPNVLAAEIIVKLSFVSSRSF